jgi:exopolysaccharide production protein ExoZ
VVRGDQLTKVFEIPGPTRMLPMEGLRGIAVLLVFFVHYATFSAPWLEGTGAAFAFAFAIKRIGNCGVDLFFVLSGFLIYGSAIKRPQPFFVFMRRRVQRLYPTFMAIFAMYMIMSLIIPSGKFPDGALAVASYVAANILLLPGIFDIEPIVSVAWSLSYEMLFYLSVPPLIAVLGLRHWSPAWRIFLFIAASLIALIFAFPWPRMIMFACGMVLSEVMPMHIRGRWLNIAAVIATVIFWLVLFQPTLSDAAVIFSFMAGLLVCLAAFGDDGFLRRFFTARPLRWLGNMSYSYYLAHGLGVQAFFLVLRYLFPPASGNGWLFFALLVPAFLASLIVSVVLYLLIERPYSILPSNARITTVVKPA